MPRRVVSGGGKSAHEFPATDNALEFVAEPIFRAQEDERKRISRELHDEIGQGLMTMRLVLGTLLKSSDEESRSTQVHEALDILDETIEGLRRIISRLSPRILDELGLLGAIRREADLVSQRSGMKAHITMPKALPELDRKAEVAIYRCIQEALHNVSRHSRARNFTVALARSLERLTIQITDDGEGFPERSFPYRGHFGLSGMRERIEELGGTLRIVSAPDKGSQIQIQIPLTNAAASSTAASHRNENHRTLSGKAS